MSDHARPHQHRRLDPHAPLVLDTRELGRRPGSMRRVQTTVPAPVDLAIEVIGVPVGADLTLDLRLESVMEGVLVSGTVVAPLTGECGRCLDPVQDEIEVEIAELFAYEDSTTRETADDDEEDVSFMVGDLLDLEPVLRDAIVVELPLTPLCSPDCPGLCADCGERLEVGKGLHHHEVVDPRWAALRELVETPEAAQGGQGD
jgi:DUF177 domain-containing protein